VSRSLADVRQNEMDEFLIDNWNSVATNKDEVNFLGDFAFRNCGYYLHRLNFKTLNVIWGNHDKEFMRYKANSGQGSVVTLGPNKCVVFKGHICETYVGKQDITLCHYAMRTWNCSHHAAWQLYGHSHGTLPDDPNSLSIDVGVDCHNYKPISFEQVKAIMEKKTFKPIDHHGA
jgi:calcineurin-like phosphoesterase family protein